MSNDPLQVNYLGVSGSTHDCTNAMITILTSPYKTDRMSIITLFCRVDDEQFYDVCFIIWRWMGEEITIVPDGFGTHGGTGGHGLLKVLNLIHLYKVPIKDRIVERDFFNRVLSARLTNEDIEELGKTRDSSDDWDTPGIYKEISYINDKDIPFLPFGFPIGLIQPEFHKDIPKMIEEISEGEDLGMVVFKVARRLESIIRVAGNYPAELVGQDLINEAVGVDKPFEPKGETKNERTSWANLFRGAFGAFRNPGGHREETLSEKDAIYRIIMLNLLLHKLKQDYPEKFSISIKAKKRDNDYTWGDVNLYALREDSQLQRLKQRRK